MCAVKLTLPTTARELLAAAGAPGLTGSEGGLSIVRSRSATLALPTTMIPRFLLAGASLAVSLLAQTVTVDLTAAPGTATLAPGITVNAWLYNGTLPGPVLRVTEGQTLRVRFRNGLPEATAIHWHGQPVMLGMDGVPGISRPAVAAGQEFLYELKGLLPGTYWFHPHGHEMQLDAGLAALLIVDPADPRRDPAFDLEYGVILDDWNDTLGGGFTGHVLNGRTSAGQAPLVVQPGQRVRLRLLNAAAVTNYVIALDGHPLTVTHADGNRVQPVVVQAIPIGIGERYDVLVECTNPGVWSLAAAAIENRNVTVVRGIVGYAGQTQPPPPANYVPPNLASGALLTYAQLAAYHAVAPITPTPDKTFTATLSMTMGTGGMRHTINGQSWPNVTPFQVAPDDQVQMTIVSSGMPMMSEYHPMHVHGHFFRLMNTVGGTTRPPLKDTVLIRPVGQAGASATVQMLMDNPGRWVFHCHNMEHMASGMMTAIEYSGDSDGDGIANRSDFEPRTAAPVTFLSEDAAAFRLGASDRVYVQWTAGQGTALFASPGELGSPLPVPPFGFLHLDPAQIVLLGTAVPDPTHRAAFPYAIPNSQSLLGLRLGFQAFGAASLPGGFRLGPFQAMTVR